MRLSQKQQVLKHLTKNKSITSWEAIALYHITRLSSVIFKLREDGYNIVTDNVVERKGGRTVSYARYVLKK